MKILKIETEQTETTWSGELRIFGFLYFALIINYLFGVRITLSAGITSFEVGVVLVRWENCNPMAEIKK
ncbi:MAG: hypothetical protein WC703_00370 [Candidatus Neomarinimicrobiota bacterium]